MLKKVTALLAAAAAVVFSLAGCGGVKENGTQMNASLDDYAPIEGKDYTYTWTYYQVAPIKSDAMMKEYWEKKFGVKFDVWDIEQSKAEEIISQRIIGGEVPDKFSVKNHSVLQKYVDQDIVAEIPMEVLEKYAPNILKRIEHDVPGALDYCKVEGKLYALPSYSMYPTRNPVAWRGDWLKNVGIDKIPDTLAEFEEAVYKFANDDPDGNGQKDTYGLSNTAMTAVYGAFGYIPIVAGGNGTTGGNWQDRDGKLVFSAVQPEMKEALTLLNKWYSDGVIDPEFITGENQGGYWALSHAFIGSRIGVSGMGQTYHWAQKFYEDTKPGQNVEEMAKINPEAASQIVLGNPPEGPDGKRGSWANSYIKDEKICFGKQLQEEPDKMGKLLQILDYIYESKENYLTATMGQEGVTYEKVEKTATNGKTYTINQGIGDFKDNKLLNANFAHTALTIFSPIFEESTESEGPNWDWEYSVNSDKYRLTNQLLVGLPSEARYKAELDKLVDETYLQIITGKQPVSYFDEFVQLWKSQGGETLEKEANEWYASIK